MTDLARGGLILGLGILFVLDRADDRLASSSEMIEQFNEPILGQIPDVADSRTSEGGIAPSGEITLRVPVDRFDDAIGRARAITGVKVLSLETYTTFHHRPALRGRPSLQWLLAWAYRLLFHEGNGSRSNCWMRSANG